MAKKRGPPRLHKRRSKAHPGFNAVARKIARKVKPRRKGQTKKQAAAAIAGSIYRKALAKRRRKR